TGRRLWGLIKKELQIYFNSPVAYMIILFFILASSSHLFFIQQFFARDTASLKSYFGLFPLLYSFVIPAITMGTFAEERRLGTEELLLTLPVTEVELVAGKYIASFILVLLMIILTLPVPWTITPLGEFDSGELLGEYTGLVLLGSMGLSFGIFVSVLSKHQISAFIAGVSGLLGLTFLRRITVFLKLPEAVSRHIRYFTLQYRFESFTRGVVDTRDVVFFLLVSFLFLYGAVKVLVFRKWR
ncbi:MAG: ABC-2 transporter permease, partial [Spirochaetaceae bacterium]